MRNLGDEQCQALLQTLWDCSITGLALVAEDGKFLAANPAYCRMLEYSEAELKMRRFQDITDPSDLAAEVEMGNQVIAGEPQSYEMVKGYYTKTRRYQEVLLRVTGLRIKEKFIYFVAEVAPIERKKESLEPKKLPSQFLKGIKDYWVQILFALGIAGNIADRVINHH